MSLSTDYTGFDLAVFADRDLELEFTVYANGVPYPGGIDPWQAFWFTAKKNLTDGDDEAILLLTLQGGGIVLTDPSNAQGKVVVRPDDYNFLIPGQPLKTWCDLVGKDPAGKLHTLQSGVIQINPIATRGAS